MLPEEKQVYTKEQRDLVIEYAKTHNNGLEIIMLLVTGISRSELLGLKWDDLGDDLVLHIRQGTVDQKNATTDKWEVITSEKLKNDFRKRDIPIEKWLYNMINSRPRKITLGGSIRNKTQAVDVETEFIW